MTWVGGVVFAGVAVTMGVYFGRVGLEDADRTASVIGAFVALVSLAVAVYPLVTGSRGAGGGDLGDARGATCNTVEGGTVHGPVVQGRDFHGDITLGTAPPRPQEPPDGERGTAR